MYLNTESFYTPGDNGVCKACGNPKGHLPTCPVTALEEANLLVNLYMENEEKGKDIQASFMGSKEAVAREVADKIWEVWGKSCEEDWVHYTHLNLVLPPWALSQEIKDATQGAIEDILGNKREEKAAARLQKTHQDRHKFYLNRRQILDREKDRLRPEVYREDVLRLNEAYKDTFQILGLTPPEPLEVTTVDASAPEPQLHKYPKAQEIFLRTVAQIITERTGFTQKFREPGCTWPVDETRTLHLFMSFYNSKVLVLSLPGTTKPEVIFKDSMTLGDVWDVLTRYFEENAIQTRT
jgi:hypothetical protein